MGKNFKAKTWNGEKVKKWKGGIEMEAKHVNRLRRRKALRFIDDSNTDFRTPNTDYRLMFT
jgi:hypothetical protein